MTSLLNKNVVVWGSITISLIMVFLLTELVHNIVVEGTMRYYFVILMFGFVTNISLFFCIIMIILAFCKKKDIHHCMSLSFVLLFTICVGENVGILINGPTPIDVEFINLKWTVISTLKHVLPFVTFALFYYAYHKINKIQLFDIRRDWTYALIFPIIVVPIVIIFQWVPIDVSQKYIDKVAETGVTPYINVKEGFSFYGNITCVNKNLNGYKPINIFYIAIAIPVFVMIEFFLTWLNNKILVKIK